MKKKGYHSQKKEEQVDESVEESLAGTAALTGLALWRSMKGADRAARVGFRNNDGSVKNYMKNYAKGALGIPDKMDSKVKVKNPKTGKEILATTAYRAGPDHPAYSAAKAALKIK
jgi:hypothetical protein